MKRFFKDLKKYYKYIVYASKSSLKSEVTNSYLSWIWLVLEPLCFMLVYAFIAGIVFKSREQYFSVFVFIGLMVWNFFNKTLISSVRLVSSNREIVTKVYIPKFVLLFITMFINLFRMIVSFSLVILFMIFLKIPFSWNILNFIPLLLTLFAVTFGVSSIFMHFGVFVEDLSNVTSIVLKLVFYMSGIFYAVAKKVPAPYGNILLTCNPLAYLISDCRNILIYQTLPNYKLMLAWFLVGVGLSIIGVNTIYKYENTYVKVMK